jgi:valyl-tRNA synthetase
MNTQGQDTGLNENDPVELSIADRWIISRLQRVEQEVARHIQQYRFDLVAQTLYEFTWDEFCDWYLELSKPILNDPHASEAAKRGTRRTLVRTLDALLRLLHPTIPFITEEIWQQVKPLSGSQGETIMLAPFPEADESRIDADAEAEMAWIQQFISGVRRIRAEMNILPSKPLPVLLTHASEQDCRWLAENEPFLKSLARLESIEILDNEDNAPESAVALVGEMKVLIPMAGLIDKEAELARLEKELDKLRKEAERLEKKLGNENFVSRAPAEVVAKEKQKLEDVQTALNNLEEQYEKIRAL